MKQDSDTVCNASDQECAYWKECAVHYTNYKGKPECVRWAALFRTRGPRDAKCPWFEQKEKDNEKRDID